MRLFSVKKKVALTIWGKRLNLMSQLKKVSTPEALGIRIEGPFSEELIKVRDKEYTVLSNIKFAARNR